MKTSALETRIQRELSFGLGIDDTMQIMVRGLVKSIVEKVKAEAVKTVMDLKSEVPHPEDCECWGHQVRRGIAAEIKAL